MLSRDNSVKTLCSMMGVSRAGYYKWLKHKPSSRDINREELLSKVQEVHEKHQDPWLPLDCCIPEDKRGMSISDSYVYKCFQVSGDKV